MAKKEYIGITHEYDKLRIARLRVVKHGLELVEVEALDLPTPLTTGMDQGMDLFDSFDDSDDLGFFETGSEGEPLDAGDNLLDDLDDPSAPSSPGSESALEDSFDMTKIDDDVEVAADNERLLAEYFTKEGKKKIYAGLHIPFGKTTFHFLKNVDPAKMKKNARHEFFREKLQPIADRDISPDHYSWVKIGENNCLLAYNPDESELINLIELAETYYNGKVHINELLPEESIWAGLARANYNLQEDDITGLIGLGESSSRIVFMKGQEIVNTLPIITEGESSDDVLNTVFSKILFEIDKGNLPKITRLLVTRSSRLKETVTSYLKKQFEDVEVDYLTPHPDNLSYSNELLNSPVYLQPYLTAIGAAWAASKVNEKEFSQLSLLPEYILEKQRMLKLEWHGIIILVLIALTPLFINTLYNSKASELQELQRENTLISSQIEDLRPIASMTESLMADLQELQAENDRILELARYSQQWSETLIKLNQGVGDISNIWLTSVRSSDAHVNITGYSLTRQQVPMLANLFSDANIHQVNETEIRGQDVYNFSMQVNSIRQDLDEFLLEMPDANFEIELPEEYQLELSHLREHLPANQSDVPQATHQQPEEPAEPAATQDPLQDMPVSTDQPVQTKTPEEREAVNQTPEPETNTEPVPEPAEQTELPSPTTTAETDTPQTENHLPEEIESVSQLAFTEKPDESSYGVMEPEPVQLIGAYTIVLDFIEQKEEAFTKYQSLAKEGYKATLWEAEMTPGRKVWRVGIGQFETLNHALTAAQELPEVYAKNNFIIRIR
ncbi:MAG: SPOR domain-containing protein [Balneolaceae bacterium]|nr:SPOR domain-containing protein [Balneolaceae bacterium]